MVSAVEDARRKKGLPAAGLGSLLGPRGRGLDHAALERLLAHLPPADRQRSRLVFKLMSSGRKADDVPPPLGAPVAAVPSGSARTDGLFAKHYDK